MLNKSKYTGNYFGIQSFHYTFVPELERQEKRIAYS
jgi:hypothetical protein